MKPEDFLGLSPAQAETAERIDREMMLARQAIAVWHRLLDRRRSDMKLGLHKVAEFGLAEKPSDGEQGRLVRRDGDGSDAAPAGGASPERAPFHVTSEHEARALLLRCTGYLTDASGSRLAFDKGVGEKDKMAEWIAREVQQGALDYIRKRQPYVFGIPLAVADS
jgi:hypothetical protein